MRRKNGKILIFSDTHLAKQFDVRTYDFLRSIITSSDHVIINGDFWDSWFTDFDGFLKSEWKRLFPLLLKKHTIYIYGNHDPARVSNRNVKQFCVTSVTSYEFSLSGTTYYVEHGNKLVEGKSTRLIELYGRLLKWADKNEFKNFLYPVLHFLEYLGFTVLGAVAMTTSPITRYHNEIMKRSNKGNKFLICGDSHHPEMDRKSRFANTGCVLYGFGSFLTIDEGKIKLVKKNF